MKKLFKKISKFLALTLVLAVSTLSFVACSNSTQGNPVDNFGQVSNISDNNNTVTDTQPATPVDKTEEGSGSESETAESTINGIFKFDNYALNFSNIYYADEDELFKFFGLSDRKEFNSLYDVVKLLGFNEFANNITNLETSKRAYIFKSDNTINHLTFDAEENYTYVESDRNFTYEVTETGIVSSDKTVELVYDAETKVLTMRFEFTYEKDGETIYTPLYIETTLSLVANSVGIYDGVPFDYVANSVKIYDVTSISAQEELELMAKVFGIEVQEDTDLRVAIENHLAGFTLSISKDMSVITLIKADGNFTFVKVDDNGIYSINNRINFQVESNTHKLDGTNLITFKVVLENGSHFTFEYLYQI